MRQMLFLPIILIGLSSCEVQRVQRAMEYNTYAIQRSTCAIERNVEALQKVTENLEQMQEAQ